MILLLFIPGAFLAVLGYFLKRWAISLLLKGKEDKADKVLDYTVKVFQAGMILVFLALVIVAGYMGYQGK